MGNPQIREVRYFYHEDAEAMAEEVLHPLAAQALYSCAFLIFLPLAGLSWWLDGFDL